MSQADILSLLDERINKTKLLVSKYECEQKRLRLAWCDALEKDDIALLLGISIEAASKNLHKLLLQDKIVALTSEKDQRKRRYMIKDGKLV